MSKRISYLAQLDSLRAVSIIIVLLSHWLRDAGISNVHYFGRYGVDLFFVISGFLLTSILLKQKGNAPETKFRFKLIKGFFLKRAFRLFPAYYALLIGLLVIHYSTGFWIWNKGEGIYYFTYTSNFLFYFDDYKSPALNHTWSLCVEEQFYLILPWLVLFSGERFVKITFIFLFFFSIFLIWKLDGNEKIRVLVPGNLHTLGAGVLLACFIERVKLTNQQLINLAIIFSGTGIIAGYALNFIFVHELSVAVLGAALVYKTSVGFKGVAGTLFNNSSVQFIGKISYGLYLYHRMVPHFVAAITNKINISFDKYFLFSLYCLITIVISVVSYYYLEKPFLKLKEKYDY